MKLSVVVPCYNERDNIPSMLERFKNVIAERDIEVVLVNNGSTDESAKIINRLLPDYSFVTFETVEVNQGYGYGVLRGLKIATGDYIGWTHADMQTDPNDVVRAYDFLNKKQDKNVFVKGRRVGRPLKDTIFTDGMSVFESLLFGERLNDINAQPNIFPREFYEKWQEPPTDFSLDLYALYKARKMGLNVVRFPVEFKAREYGESKWNTGIKSKIKFIKRTLEYSFELKKNEKTEN